MTRAAAAFVFLTVAAFAEAETPPPAPSCAVTDPCTRPSRPGETALVLLGDAGYGQGGSSEWGTHAQGQIAARMDRLCPRPDIVVFLGDNIYWKGSPDLFGPRFDTVYEHLLDADHRRVHAALGNHDVKGCQVSGLVAFDGGETCADALDRLIREDVRRDSSAAQGPAVAEAAAQRSALLAPDLASRAVKVPATDCLPASDIAYEQDQASGSGCYATQALRHSEFGYGLRGGNPLRYYTIDWPPAALTAPADAARVRVLVADSNTLRVEGSLLPRPGADGAFPRTDALQVLWIENQLLTAPADAWKLVVMHHPPYSPRGCVFKMLGRCIGGHDDEVGLRDQLQGAFETPPGAENAPRPDLIVAAHNHLYARTRALDALGYPARAKGTGVRYFVSGGGGAPLYRVQPLHARYAQGGSFYHFTFLRLRRDAAFFWIIDEGGRVRDSGCFAKGDPVDHCIASGSYDDERLACGGPAPATPGTCPAPRP